MSERELIACWEETVLRIEIDRPTLTIGRTGSCEVHLPHASVSRSHARLHFDDQGVEIEDLGSSNGTRVDGVAVRGRAKVVVGALIEVGSVRLILQSKTRPDEVVPSAMGEVRRMVDKFAVGNLSLILLGETGVGKEVLTEEIHARSRKNGPLVKLNCAGLAATLLESEIFGHERGAFTGADQAKAGLIESADGGTLFLDELGEMPESTQAKLLRVLETREVRRLGALRGKTIDVRFVSATHRDLRSLSAIGKFREDLLFRLNGFTLRIPPLRERRDEVATLATTFLAKASERLAIAPPRLSNAALALLEGYHFPGNIRELRNVLERAAHICEGGVVLCEHLVFDTAPRASLPGPLPREDLEESRERSATPASERDRIVMALASSGGNVAAAAAELGLTPRVLGYRMDKLGLPRPRRKQ